MQLLSLPSSTLGCIFQGEGGPQITQHLSAVSSVCVQGMLGSCGCAGSCPWKWHPAVLLLALGVPARGGMRNAVLCVCFCVLQPALLSPWHTLQLPRVLCL